MLFRVKNPRQLHRPAYSTALLLAFGAGLLATPHAASQTPLPTEPPRFWAEQAAASEIPIIDDNGKAPLRYRIHKIEAKGDTTREIIETRQGSVARLIERNGQPITAAEDTAERARLAAILKSPDDFINHHKRDAGTRNDTLQLVRLMPQAMLYTYTPGQPQPPNATGLQVVLDFHPDPGFHPPTMMSDLLTGLEGRIWIDAKSRCMTRIEAHVLHAVNFGWGIVGHIYPGGTIAFEQANPGGDRWVYSRADTHLTMRVVVHTVPMDDRMSASDFQLLPAPVTFQQAVKLLLAEQIPLR